MRQRTYLALAIAMGWVWFGLGSPGAEAGRIEFLGHQFVTCRVELPQDRLWLCWKDDAGQLLGSFTRLCRHLAGRGEEVTFAINAGIYSASFEPLGLHVEERRVLRPLNTGAYEGRQFNFYLKPNGVFFIKDGRPAIVETGEYERLALVPDLACQSGPLLLNRGMIHPAFRPGSTNLHWRSGVGVTRSNQAIFVLSVAPLCFHDFARVFKERLGCTEALYLDGDICAVYLPELGYKHDATTRYAGMFAVTRSRVRPANRTP